MVAGVAVGRWCRVRVGGTAAGMESNNACACELVAGLAESEWIGGVVKLWVKREDNSSSVRTLGVVVDAREVEEVVDVGSGAV